MKGGAILLSHKELLLAIVPGIKVLGLQFSQDLEHPRDEGFVPPLLYIVDPGLRPFINCERHKRWDGP